MGSDPLALTPGTSSGLGCGIEACREHPTDALLIIRGSSRPTCLWSTAGLGLKTELGAGSGCGGVTRRLGAKPGQETGGPGVLDGRPSKLLSECRCSLLDRQLLTWGYKRVNASSSHPGDGRAFPFSLRYAPKKQWLLPRARYVDGNQVCARPKDREAREQSVCSSGGPAARSNRG